MRVAKATGLTIRVTCSVAGCDNTFEFEGVADAGGLAAADGDQASAACEGWKQLAWVERCENPDCKVRRHLHAANICPSCATSSLPTLKENVL